MEDKQTPKVAPEWVRETYGATALELGLYEDDEMSSEPAGSAATRLAGARPAWMEME
jgi:hypothetical protein